MILGAAIAVVMAGAAAAQSTGPCAPDSSCAGKGADAERLEAAWRASVTTDEQRQRMTQAVNAHRNAAGVDYTAAANEYFAWRIQATGYDPGKVSTSPADTARIAAQERARYRRMRLAAESAVKGRLIDPSSAEFEYLGGFLTGQWKPFLAKRVSGDIVCGTVNARNRMGGYVGRTAFVVVLNGETPVFVDMDSGRPGLDLVSLGCSKTPLPRFQDGMLDGPPPPVTAAAPPTSVADELAKLAKLREQGVLTQAEFEAQKAKLLQ